MTKSRGTIEKNRFFFLNFAEMISAYRKSKDFLGHKLRVSGVAVR